MNDKFDQLELVSADNNGYYSFPMNPDGTLCLELGCTILNQAHADKKDIKVTNRILQTCLQDAGLSLNNECMYYLFDQEVHTIDEHDVIELEFAKALKNLKPNYFLPSSILNFSEGFRLILQCLSLAKNYLKGQVYTPFINRFNGHYQQIDIFQSIQILCQTIEKDLHSFNQKNVNAQALKFYDCSQNAMIIGGIVRAYLLPQSISVSLEPKDYDTGRCNIFCNTSFRRGDLVFIIAKYKDFYFVWNSASYGWVKSRNLAYLSEKSMHRINSNFKQEFYVGHKPYFAELEQVVLPGDTVFTRKNEIYLAVRDNNMNLVLKKINDMLPETITNFIKTPAELVNFVYGLNLPYMYAVFDCSEIIRRCFILLGYNVRKYSGDLIADLVDAGIEEITISDKDKLSQLNNGLYIANLLERRQQGELVSKHLYLVLKTDKEFRALSYAFQILNGDNVYEFPIGIHENTVDGLINQIHANHIIKFYNIAASWSTVLPN